MSELGKKLIDGLQDAIAGNFKRVTIAGQTWVRADVDSPEELLAKTRGSLADLTTEYDVIVAERKQLRAEIDALRSERADLKKNSENGVAYFDAFMVIQDWLFDHGIWGEDAQEGDPPEKMLIGGLERLFAECEAAPEEIKTHLNHKAEAHFAVREVMALCQHSPQEWMEMSPELRDFKLKIFSTLEMRCLNLGCGTRGITQEGIIAENTAKFADLIKAKEDRPALEKKGVPNE